MRDARRAPRTVRFPSTSDIPNPDSGLGRDVLVPLREEGSQAGGHGWDGRRMPLIMLAPPGAGKGTHSRRLSRDTGIAHISSGDLLRAEIARATDRGQRLAGFVRRGDLVPDDLIFDILTPVVVAAARDTGGYCSTGSRALCRRRYGRRRSACNSTW